ncbi:hypothetical protein PSH28_13750 [Pseudomonas resinovorans]|nr:hypothetical protein [Pseudomonas resinovorans]MDE3737664.1 hypothetical protein [Pseudomonas resinovorans]
MASEVAPWDQGQVETAGTLPLDRCRTRHDDPERNLPWRDTDLRIEGPVVADLQKLFITTWDRQKGGTLVARHYFPPLERKGREVVRAIGSSPD